MRRSTNWLLAGVLSLLAPGVAPPVAAQEVSRVEVSAGWHYFPARVNADERWVHFLDGWYVDVAGTVNDTWAIVGQVAGSHTTLTEFEGDVDVTFHPYLFGVRANFRNNAQATVFAQFLAGATNMNASLDSEETNQTEFTYQLGGGVNIHVTEKFAVRVGADYLRIDGGSEDGNMTAGEAIHGLRLAVGAVLGF